MSSKLIIGPVFFFEESTINQQNYLDMVKKNFFYPFLQEKRITKKVVSRGWSASPFLEDSSLLVA
jgi:hypothetical protein